MEHVQQKQYDANGDDWSKDEGVSPFPQVHPLYQAVDEWIFIWTMVKYK